MKLACVVAEVSGWVQWRIVLDLLNLFLCFTVLILCVRTLVITPLVIGLFDLLLSVFPPEKAVVVERVWGFASIIVWALCYWCLSANTRLITMSIILRFLKISIDIYITFIPSPLVKWFPAALNKGRRVLGRWVIGLIVLVLISIDQDGESIWETMEDGLGQMIPFHGRIWLGVVHDELELVGTATAVKQLLHSLLLARVHLLILLIICLEYIFSGFIEEEMWNVMMVFIYW